MLHGSKYLSNFLPFNMKIKSFSLIQYQELADPTMR